MLMGLFPVFTKASVLALVYGPKRKPTYKVTRKEDEFALYWRETMIQSGCVLALVASIIYSFRRAPSTSPSTLEPSTGRFSSHLLPDRSQVMVRHLVAPKEGTNGQRRST